MSVMISLLRVLSLVFGFTLTFASARDLTTLNGTVFKDVAVTKVTAVGVNIQHSYGAAFVPKKDLPSEFSRDFYIDEQEAAAAATPTQSSPQTLSTLEAGGETYQNIVVLSIEPLGIHIQHSGGVAFINFKLLSPELQKRFGFDDASYQAALAALRQQQEEARAAAALQQAVVSSPQSTETSSSSEYVPDSEKTVHVSGYYRKDGTYVHSYYRRPPSH